MADLEAIKKRDEDAGFFRVLFMGTRKAACTMEGLDHAYQDLIGEQKSFYEMPKIVIRLSVHGLQAKYWETRRWSIDVPVFYVKWVSAAGRLLVFMAQDSGQVGTEAPEHTVYVLVCENEETVHRIAQRLTQVCKTIAASLKAIQDRARANDMDAGAPAATDSLPVGGTLRRSGATQMSGNILEEMARLLAAVRAMNLLPIDMARAEAEPSRVLGGSHRHSVDHMGMDLSDMELGISEVSAEYLASITEQVFARVPGTAVKKAVKRSSVDYRPPTI